MKQNSGSKGFSRPPATSEILGLAGVPPPPAPLAALGCAVGAARGLLLVHLLGLQSPGSVYRPRGSPLSQDYK